MTDVSTLSTVFFAYLADRDGAQKIGLIFRDTALEAAEAFHEVGPAMGLSISSMLQWSPSQDDYNAISSNPDLVLTINAD